MEGICVGLIVPNIDWRQATHCGEQIVPVADQNHDG